MSHEFESGFSVREVPWHGLGKVLDDYPGSWAEARTLAGLDWEPIAIPQYMPAYLGLDEGGEPILDLADLKPVGEFKYVCRSDTGARLDSANSTYELITHAEMGEIVEAILDVDDHKVKYETAGSLAGGKKVWALARLGDQIEIKGDSSPLQPYLALMTSHDGTAAMKAVATAVRIVCANTWHAADMDSEASGTAYTFKHTKNWRQHVESAREAVLASARQIDEVVGTARELLSVRYDKAMQDDFVKRFAIERVIINAPKSVTDGNVLAYLRDNPRVEHSMAETTRAVKALLASQTCADLEPTAYQMVQAAGEFADHVRKYVSKDTYFSRTVIDTEPLKRVATKLAFEVAR